jgi:hypothetical protein
MAKKIKKPQRGVSKDFFRASDRVSQKIQAAITELDVCVSGFENRWGVDRLPELVSAETQQKYWRQVDKLDAAIEANDADLVIKYAAGMMRAYAAMQNEARERGHDELQGTWYECETPDGRVLIVAPSFEEAHKAARERPGCIVYAMPEIAAIICRDEAGRFANAVKEVFPAATVESVRQTKDDLNDEIPF